MRQATDESTTLPKPKPRRRRAVNEAMRRRIEAAIDAMIDALDTLDAPTEDMEDDDPAGGQVDDDPIDEDTDSEPSLGSFDRLMNQEHGWIECYVLGHWPYADRELDPAEREADEADQEGAVDDGPCDTDELEACLAHDDELRPKSAAASIADQRAAGAALKQALALKARVAS